MPRALLLFLLLPLAANAANEQRHQKNERANAVLNAPPTRNWSSRKGARGEDGGHERASDPTAAEAGSWGKKEHSCSSCRSVLKTPTSIRPRSKAPSRRSSAGWMRLYPDMRLVELAMPATLHSTLTDVNSVRYFELAVAQKAPVSTQLLDGIRMFDVRAWRDWQDGLWYTEVPWRLEDDLRILRDQLRVMAETEEVTAAAAGSAASAAGVFPGPVRGCNKRRMRPRGGRGTLLQGRGGKKNVEAADAGVRAAQKRRFSPKQLSVIELHSWTSLEEGLFRPVQEFLRTHLSEVAVVVISSFNGNKVTTMNAAPHASSSAASLRRLAEQLQIDQLAGVAPGFQGQGSQVEGHPFSAESLRGPASASPAAGAAQNSNEAFTTAGSVNAQQQQQQSQSAAGQRQTPQKGVGGGEENPNTGPLTGSAGGAELSAALLRMPVPTTTYEVLDPLDASTSFYMSSSVRKSLSYADVASFMTLVDRYWGQLLPRHGHVFFGPPDDAPPQPASPRPPANAVPARSSDAAAPADAQAVDAGASAHSNWELFDERNSTVQTGGRLQRAAAAAPENKALPPPMSKALDSAATPFRQKGGKALTRAAAAARVRDGFELDTVSKSDPPSSSLDTESFLEISDAYSLTDQSPQQQAAAAAAARGALPTDVPPALRNGTGSGAIGAASSTSQSTFKRGQWSRSSSVGESPSAAALLGGSAEDERSFLKGGPVPLQQVGRSFEGQYFSNNLKLYPMYESLHRPEMYADWLRIQGNYWFSEATIKELLDSKVRLLLLVEDPLIAWYLTVYSREHVVVFVAADHLYDILYKSEAQFAPCARPNRGVSASPENKLSVSREASWAKCRDRCDATPLPLLGKNIGVKGGTTTRDQTTGNNVDSSNEQNSNSCTHWSFEPDPLTTSLPPFSLRNPEDMLSGSSPAALGSSIFLSTSAPSWETSSNTSSQNDPPGYNQRATATTDIEGGAGASTSASNSSAECSEAPRMRPGICRLYRGAMTQTNIVPVAGSILQSRNCSLRTLYDLPTQWASAAVFADLTDAVCPIFEAFPSPGGGSGGAENAATTVENSGRATTPTTAAQKKTPTAAARSDCTTPDCAAKAPPAESGEKESRTIGTATGRSFRFLPELCMLDATPRLRKDSYLPDLGPFSHYNPPPVNYSAAPPGASVNTTGGPSAKKTFYYGAAGASATAENASTTYSSAAAAAKPFSGLALEKKLLRVYFAPPSPLPFIDGMRGGKREVGPVDTVALMNELTATWALWQLERQQLISSLAVSSSSSEAVPRSGRFAGGSGAGNQPLATEVEDSVPAGVQRTAERWRNLPVARTQAEMAAAVAARSTSSRDGGRAGNVLGWGKWVPPPFWRANGRGFPAATTPAAFMEERAHRRVTRPVNALMVMRYENTKSLIRNFSHLNYFEIIMNLNPQPRENNFFSFPYEETGDISAERYVQVTAILNAGDGDGEFMDSEEMPNRSDGSEIPGDYEADTTLMWLAIGAGILCLLVVLGSAVFRSAFFRKSPSRRAAGWSPAPSVAVPNSSGNGTTNNSTLPQPLENMAGVMQ